MIKRTIEWHDASVVNPGGVSGATGRGPGNDEFLIFWWGPNEEENVEIDRWLGNQWKHRSPDYWAEIPLP